MNQEVLTFTGLLSRQATTYEAMAALSNGIHRPRSPPAPRRPSPACCGMDGQPAAERQQMVMRHCRDRNAIGPIRGVASRTQDVIGAVPGTAAVVRPAADLARLANLLPVQLELGIPADFAPLALAGAGPTRRSGTASRSRLSPTAVRPRTATEWEHSCRVWPIPTRAPILVDPGCPGERQLTAGLVASGYCDRAGFLVIRRSRAERKNG
jgi:hypothetical protein